MKRKFIYLLPALLVLTIFATGCLKNDNPPPTISYPSGTFNGQFRLLHRNLTNNKIDTPKRANIQLVLDSGMAYKVLGDTTVHAGSKGQYGINSAYMAFDDNTYPKTGTPAKIHLHGNYSYIYNGSTLVILAVQGDTLNYRYDLKKVN